MQVEGRNANINNCGMTGCDSSDRYDKTIEQCRDACEAWKGCRGFNWAPVNGDRNHLDKTVCTLYRKDHPEHGQYWGAQSNILQACEIVNRSLWVINKIQLWGHGYEIALFASFSRYVRPDYQAKRMIRRAYLCKFAAWLWCFLFHSVVEVLLEVLGLLHFPCFEQLEWETFTGFWCSSVRTWLLKNPGSWQDREKRCPSVF